MKWINGRAWMFLGSHTTAKSPTASDYVRELPTKGYTCKGWCYGNLWFLKIIIHNPLTEGILLRPLPLLFQKFQIGFLLFFKTCCFCHPPPPWNFHWPSVGGMDIFWNCTISTFTHKLSHATDFISHRSTLQFKILLTVRFLMEVNHNTEVLVSLYLIQRSIHLRCDWQIVIHFVCVCLQWSLNYIESHSRISVLVLIWV